MTWTWKFEVRATKNNNDLNPDDGKTYTTSKYVEAGDMRGYGPRSAAERVLEQLVEDVLDRIATSSKNPWG